MSTVLRNNDELVSDLPSAGDAVMVERFIRARDEAAFTQLVHRHGPVVLGVCRRVLRDVHDIEDVFQATFLVFVRDAVRVRNRKSLASWLYGVAFRLSLRLVRNKQRLRETDLPDNCLVEDDTFKKITERQDLQIVDAELNAMPERYRLPLVLRYLVGKSTSEIAVELGKTVGAVEGLLKRGKDELGTRLLKRGINFGVALFAIQIAQRAVEAASNQTLIHATSQSGLAWKPGIDTLPSDLVSSQAVELAGKEIIVMSTATKSTIAVGVTLGGLALGLGGVAVMSNPSGGKAEAASINTIVSVSRQAIEGLEIATTGNEPISPSKAEEKALNAEKPTEQVESSPVAGNMATGVPTATEARATEGKWDFKSRSPVERKIERELLFPTEVNFSDIPLHDALEFLSDTHHIQIWTDQKSLSDEGMSFDQTVTLVTTGIPVKSNLHLLLDPLLLDYVIQDNLLKITTKTVANETFETRVYNTRNLPRISAKDLTELITSLVEPDCWNDAATAEAKAPTSSTGTTTKDETHLNASSEKSDVKSKSAPIGNTTVNANGGTIRSIRNTIVIRQTQRIHEKIVELLEQLEQAEQQNGNSANESKPAKR